MTTLMTMPTITPLPPASFPFDHFQGIPGIEVASNGRLWATWYGGGMGEGIGNAVVLVTSGDDGLTWSPLRLIAPSGQRRAFDPVLWRDPRGRLWWCWSESVSERLGHIFDGRAGVWASIAANPDHADTAWSEPRRLDDGVMMNKPSVLADGAWAFPISYWPDVGGGRVPDELRRRSGANVVVSDDDGQTFHWRGGVSLPKRSFDEHQLVELDDGRLRMLIRHPDGISQHRSHDGGRTWIADAADPPGPDSRFHCCRLPSGSLILINHQIDPSEVRVRRMLTVTISDDDGASWQGGLVIDARDSVSYPDACVDNSGALLIIYDRDRQGCGEILLARVREADIRACRLVSADAVLRRLVSRLATHRPA